MKLEFRGAGFGQLLVNVFSLLRDEEMLLHKGARKRTKNVERPVTKREREAEGTSMLHFLLSVFGAVVSHAQIYFFGVGPCGTMRKSIFFGFGKGFNMFTEISLI